MKNEYSFNNGSTVWQSKEFRAFAMKWLGFDPWDRDIFPEVKDATIRMPCDEPVTFMIDQMALVKMEDFYQTDMQAAQHAEKESPAGCHMVGEGNFSFFGTEKSVSKELIDSVEKGDRIKNWLDETADVLKDYWIIQRLSDGWYWSENTNNTGVSEWVDFPENATKYVGRLVAEKRVGGFSFETCRAVPLKKEVFDRLEKRIQK